MTQSPVTVHPDASVEEVVRTLQHHELPGVPVVDDDDHLLGIVTESDLVLSDDEGDLHIPHYLELFGGILFLGPLRRFEGRLRQAAPAPARDMMTRDPATLEADDPVRKPAPPIADSGRNPV